MRSKDGLGELIGIVKELKYAYYETFKWYDDPQLGSRNSSEADDFFRILLSTAKGWVKCLKSWSLWKLLVTA